MAKSILYNYNFFYNYKLHSGQTWNISKFDVERDLRKQFPEATDFYVWMD
jgi:hypothetical protein